MGTNQLQAAVSGMTGLRPARVLPWALLLCALWLCAGCHRRGAYPAPADRTLPALVPVEPDAHDSGDLAGMRALEAACRVRLSGDTAAGSIAALDRVREVLGAGCDIATVAHDPLHWQLRCRSDALFDSGQYSLSGKPVACAELSSERVPAWQCVGAVLSGLLGQAKGGRLQRLDVAVVGHVDARPLRPKSRSHLCTDLQAAVGFAPDAPWSEVPELASDEERAYANQQLALCRAASVTDALRSGAGQTAGQNKPAGQATAGVHWAVLGMGSSWLRAQPGGACPSSGKTPDEDRDCADARRVDILLRFTPRTDAYTTRCERDGDDARTALYCLQQCLESAAVGRQAVTPLGVAPPASPLRSPPAGPARLPPGWYVHTLGDAGASLDVAPICETLGMSPAACGLDAAAE